MTEREISAMPTEALRTYALVRSLMSVANDVAGFREFAEQLLADCGPMSTARCLCEGDGYAALTDKGAQALEAVKAAQSCVLGNEVSLPDALGHLEASIQELRMLHSSSREAAASLIDAYPDLLTGDEAQSYSSRLSTYLHVFVFSIAVFFGLEPLAPLSGILSKEMNRDVFLSLREALDQVESLIEGKRPVGAWRIVRGAPDLAVLPDVHGCIYEDGISLGDYEVLKGQLEEISPGLLVVRDVSLEAGETLMAGYGRIVGIDPTRSYEYADPNACDELPIYAFDGQSLQTVLIDPLLAIASTPELDGARNFSIHPFTFAQALDRTLRCESFSVGGKRQICLVCGKPVNSGLFCKKKGWFAR